MDTNVTIPAMYMLTGRNASGAGTASAPKSLWFLLDWGTIEQTVRTLQVRIAQATKKRLWRKVRSLRWLLTHSLATKLLAVRRVTQNAGQRTPGYIFMLENIPLNRKVLQQWLAAGFVEKQRWYPSAHGTPQGSVISPTLANMVLDGLESHLDKTLGIRHIGKTGRRDNPHQIHLVRYADDFIVTANNAEILPQIRQAVTRFLADRGLELSEEKTSFTHLSAGLDFLGQHLRLANGRLIITPARKNVQTFLDNVRRTIHKMRAAPALDLIEKLTPMLRGWAMYHRHICAAATFSAIDHTLVELLRKWAKRRHGHRKSVLWQKQKYFRTVKNRDWVFTAKDEEGNHVDLFQTASVKIKRWPRIKATANPFDPEWEVYFERRQQEKMAEKFAGRNLLAYLYRRQEGKCAHCRQPITTETGWDRHHLHPKHLGGNDADDNLVLLHPNCHEQVHHEGLHLEPPVKRRRTPQKETGAVS